ncbi:MAG TPA: response regulator [Spirochaetota bacterium]|jgi:DNA-binding response OmpR family regulator|nr:response regulator [Spirochaetota bacterium]OQB00336.1 MAG: Transcriptional regulatory protein ZraR [Spirochaetes bacterium ADurb.Bin218]HOK02336.1 response regulator [Spirochaetota bacterium]HOK92526.1 response regulator [Spirochaetota bacterium]HON15296.1 response regulator [Spirochaetota bacterium]
MARILIVEDEENLRELYAEELAESGYEVEKAHNGKDALNLINKKDFDIVLMDIRMPEMDGIETLGKIITMEKKIPVIIYTAYSNYKSNFMTWTADAYLTKSSNLDELKAKIEELLAAKKSQGR